jgi:Zn ribbon nucleic-acid-binding protein
MLKFLKRVVEALRWKRTCSLCDGTGWYLVDWRDNQSEYLRCVVCGGKGSL